MKTRDFKEYKATVQDDDGDSHDSVIRAHVVTEDTAGRVATRIGSQEAEPGSVLVETDKPGVYDVLDSDAWKSTGYGKPKPKPKQSGGSRAKSGT